MCENCIEFMFRNRTMMTGIGAYVHKERRWVVYLGEEKAEGRQN
jgi:hypothetical protein